MPFDRTLWETGDLLCDAQLMKLSRAWRLPLIMRERIRTIRAFFKR